MMDCPHCGTKNEPNDQYCESCGQRMTPHATGPLDNATRKLPPQTGGMTPQKQTARSGDTQPLAIEPFMPLPEGAIVGPYLVTLQYQEAPANRHLYQVQSRIARKVCPQCGMGENSADKKFCTRCGFDIREQQPIYPSYLLTEAAQKQALGSAFTLTSQPLQEAGIRLPLRSLQMSIADKPRYYVASDLGGQPLATLHVPVEVTQVVKWGGTLARALDELQRHNVGWPQLTAQHILVEGERIFFAQFFDAVASSAENTSQLAAIINWLLTGQDQHAPHPELSNNLNSLLQRAISQSVTSAELATAFTQEEAALRRPASTKLQLGQISDVGMVRQLNEDSLLSLHFTHNNRSQNKPVGLYVVADGMGGHEGGEVASGLTVDVVGQLAVSQLLPQVMSDKWSIDYDKWLQETIQAANKAVYAKAKASHNDMGTTVVVAVVVDDEAYIGHAGDSRAYRVNAEGIEQLTVDHSLVERLVATGQITREEARHHPQGNVVYRTIGDKVKLEVDTMHVRLAAGDCLLLCSDGLTGMVTDERIQQIVNEATSPQAACDALIRAANTAGGDDNITVIIVEVEPLREISTKPKSKQR